MAGIYIHIPFCKKACHYCDFHFSTQLTLKAAMVAGLKKEMALRHHLLKNTMISSIYFGGGTPSLLSKEELHTLMEQIKQFFKIAPKAEVTLEANPEDIDESNLKNWWHCGINRLSVGIQTFDESRLQYLNRNHTASDSIHALKCIQQSQFDNWTADLIFAIPPTNSSFSRFKKDLNILVSYEPKHISVYHLTIEKNTVLGRWQEKKKILPVSEKIAAKQFEYAHAFLSQLGFEHYEVSNYSQPAFWAQHNQSYWSGVYYLGLGPGAHSYYDNKRSWNVAHNALYLKTIDAHKLPMNEETLTKRDQYNEYILTKLRTQEGIDLDFVQKKLGRNIEATHTLYLQTLVKNGHGKLNNSHFKLTPTKGFLIADSIALALFEDTY